MSSVVNIATAAAASSRAQVQMAVAAKFVKMNADSAQSVVQLIEAANANLQQVVNSATGPGVGESVDISV
jgi:hypothetical protein